MKSDRWLAFLVGMAVGALCIVVVHGPDINAQAQESKLPFASSIDQRQQSIEELRKLSALMEKQLQVLTSGQVRVTIVDERSEVGKRKAP